MSQISNAQLTDRSLVSSQVYFPVENARCSIGAGHALEFNPPPCRFLFQCNFAEQLRRTASEGNEIYPQILQPIQIAIGSQFGIEDQLCRISTSPLFPEIHEAQNLVILILLAQLGVGIAEDTIACILSQKSQDALLAPAAF